MADLKSSIVIEFSKKGDAAVVSGVQGIENKAKSLTKVFGTLLPALTAAAVVGFFVKCIKEAEEEEKALRRLKLTIESQKGSWQEVNKEVREHANLIQANSRFSDTTYIKTLTNMVQKTGNYKGALALVNGAVGIAIKYDMDLNDVVEKLYDSSLMGSRGLRALQIEFGGVTLGATSAKDAIKKLIEENKKVKDEGLEAEWKKFGNGFKNNVMEPIGKFVGGIAQKFLATMNGIGFGLQYMTDKEKALASTILGVTEKELSALDKLLGKLEKEAKARQDLTQIEALQKKWAMEYAKTTMNTHEAVMAMVDLEYQEYAKVEKDKVKLAEWRAKKIIELEKNFNDVKSNLILQAGELAQGLLEGEVGIAKQVYDQIINIFIDAMVAKIEAAATAEALLAGITLQWWRIPLILAAGAVAKGALHALVPKAAEGGIVKATPGGRPVIVGEGGQDEAIIPLGKGIGGNITLNITGVIDDSMVKKIMKEIKKLEKYQGY